jgi:hypothetical protein
VAEHVGFLVWIGLARSLLGIALGPIFIHKAMTLTRDSYGMTPVTGEILSFDATVLLAVGIIFLAGSAVRLLQAVGARLSRPWARRVGLVLGLFDIANLAFFPVSMALGLYAVIVYRHPDTLDRFESRRASA